MEILRGVNVNLEPDRRIVILGPSGAGKSTLLRLLNRLEEPTTGRLLLGDQPLGSLPVSTIRDAVGLVFQNSRCLPGTVGENLAYPWVVRGLTVPANSDLMEDLAEVGLETVGLDRNVANLSGGECQKLALAMGLQINPEILALDEPTSSVDPNSARRIAGLLATRSERNGLRTISVCHHREHAVWLGDHAIVLDRGQMIDQGPTVEVLKRTDGGFEESDG